MTAANEMTNLGLKDLGYEYVNSGFLFPILTVFCFITPFLT